MTETRLRTRIHTAAYAFSALVFALLAYLNLLYGFYAFFYGALTLTCLAAGGLGYTWWARQRQLSAGGHLFILAAMVLTVLALGLRRADLSLFWLYPLILLQLLLLPVTRGLLLAIFTVLLPGLVILTQAVDLLVIAGLLGALLLVSMAAVFAYRYHDNAQSMGELSTIDPLTGAYNLRYFEETLRREIARSGVTGHPLSLLHLSLDYYDELQKLHGDARLQPLLRHTSETLRSTIRAGDSHYYCSRGEFLLLLPFTPEEGVRVIAERIRRVIAEGQWPVVDGMTACLGGVSWYPGEDVPESLQAGAQLALEEARRRGHNRFFHLDAHAPRQDNTASLASG